ncbi:MAG: hypothetical protein OEX19_05085 [Gammaproteobacteria bacterium]|nr:hypothetical protein [Gammaproteobacteria bacterium]
MRKNNKFWQTVIVVFLAGSLGTGCGAIKGLFGNDDKEYAEDENIIDPETGLTDISASDLASTTGAPTVGATMRFSVAGSQALMTLEKGVSTQTGDSSGKLRTRGKLAARAIDAETNLVAVDADGNTVPAMLTDGTYNVGYTVADPAKDYVYVVFDTNSVNYELAESTSSLVARRQCAIFKVSLADNAYSCALSGVNPYSYYGGASWDKVNGKFKPVQFDDAGNVFVYGQNFSSECNGNKIPVLLRNDTDISVRIPAKGFTKEEWLVLESEYALKANYSDEYSFEYDDFSVVLSTQTNYFIRSNNDSSILTPDSFDPETGQDLGPFYYIVDPGMEFQKRDENGVPLFQKDENGNDICSSYTFDTHVMIDGQQYESPFAVFRIDGQSGEVSRISQDSEDIKSFVSLGTGELVFESYNSVDTKTRLKLWNKGSVSNITTEDTYAGTYTGYTVDSYNSVLYNNFKIARPRDIGGVMKATIDTSLFSELATGMYSNWCISTDIGEDGSLYAHYGNDVCGDTGSSVKVYRVLPADPQPVAVLGKPGAKGKVFSKGFLFNVEAIEDSSYGNIDVIKVYNLADRSNSALLQVSKNEIDAGASFFDIYNWAYAGEKIIFSGIDQKKNKAVLGEINILDYVQGKTEAEVVTIHEMDSSIGASNKVVDIEITRPQQPEYDPGSAPVVQKVYSIPENLHSVSVDFSKYMNKKSVEANLIFKDDQGGAVPYLPVWFYQTLHLIPDLNGFEDEPSVQQSLATSSKYTLDFDSSTLDVYGWSLGSSSNLGDFPLIRTVNTKAKSGLYLSSRDNFYSGVFDISETVASANIGAVSGCAQTCDKPVYNLGVGREGDLKIDLSLAYPSQSGEVELILWNKTEYASTGSEYSAEQIKITMSSHGLGVSGVSPSFYDSVSFSEDKYAVLYNSSAWRTYRVEIVGDALKVYFSTDGENYTEVSELSNAGLANPADEFVWVLKYNSNYSDAILTDNLVFTMLDTDGGVLNVDGDLLKANFDAGMAISTDTGPGDGVGFDDNVANDLPSVVVN